MACHSVESDAEFAYGLQQQELALLDDSHIARNLQDNDILVIDDDADEETSDNRQITANDEELALQLQQEFDAELRNERSCRHRRTAASAARQRIQGQRRAARPRDDDDPHNNVFFQMDSFGPHMMLNNMDVVLNGASVVVNGLPFTFQDTDSDTDDYEALWDLAEQNGDVGRRGLDTDEINVLPTSKVSEKKPLTSSQSEKTANSENAECRICLSLFQSNETLRTLPCLHQFHRHCIDKWIKRNAVCPVCRVKLRDQIGASNE